MKLNLFLSWFHSRSENQAMVCAALNSLINDCTVVLGWCYTSTEVEVTKQKQKVLMQRALIKMFPQFDIQQCLKEEEGQGHDLVNDQGRQEDELLHPQRALPQNSASRSGKSQGESSGASGSAPSNFTAVAVSVFILIANRCVQS